MNNPIYILHVDAWMIWAMMAGALIVIFTALLEVIDWLRDRLPRRRRRAVNNKLRLLTGQSAMSNKLRDLQCHIAELLGLTICLSCARWHRKSRMDAVLVNLDEHCAAFNLWKQETQDLTYAELATVFGIDPEQR